MLITLALVSGLGLGSMYGLLALGFYVTYSVSNTVNFAQGSSMMLGAVLCYTFAVTLGWNPVPSVLQIFYLRPEAMITGLVVTVAVGAASGLLPAFGAMRLRVVDALRRV